MIDGYDETAVLGMKVVLPVGIPLGSIVCLKYLDEDGDIRYAFGTTEGITAVEAIGMLKFTLIRLVEHLKND